MPWSSKREAEDCNALSFEGRCRCAQRRRAAVWCRQVVMCRSLKRQLATPRRRAALRWRAAALRLSRWPEVLWGVGIPRYGGVPHCGSMPHRGGVPYCGVGVPHCGGVRTAAACRSRLRVVGWKAPSKVARVALHHVSTPCSRACKGPCGHLKHLCWADATWLHGSNGGACVAL